MLKQTNKGDVSVNRGRKLNKTVTINDEYVNKDYVIIYKNNGKFLIVFNEDALIFNWLFNYKVLPGLKCGFPNTILNRVLDYLEKSCISYKIVYNNQIIKELDLGNNNQYSKILIIAKKNVSVNERIDLLIKNIKASNPEILEKVIESIEECLK